MSHSFDALVLLTLIPAEICIFTLFIIYIDTHLRKPVDICYFHDGAALTTIVMVGISTLLFR